MDKMETGELHELLSYIDQELQLEESANKLISLVTEGIFRIDDVINTINDYVIQKVAICNLLAIKSFEFRTYDNILPLLQQALLYDDTNRDTLMNLSCFLEQCNEYELALHYATQLKDNDEEIVQLLERLRSNLTCGQEDNILSIEQNDVLFTGERLVINKTVKDQFNNVLEEHLARYELACSFANEKIVLDAASGAGYGSKMIKEAGAHYVMGVDISSESVESARLTYGSTSVDFAVGNVNDLPFNDGTFDMVVSFETIEHIDNGAFWIKESARVLKDGGLFLVSTPNRAITNPGIFFNERPLNPHHQFEYTTVEFVGELLKEYDIVNLYGQSFINDANTYYTQVMRKARELGVSSTPILQDAVLSTQLSPLSEVKDAQPMYVVAVCRKKSARSGELRTETEFN